LRLEVRNYVILALDELSFFVAQGIFSGLKSLAKTFDINSFFLSLFASLLAGLELSLQVIGPLLSKTQRL
jgi:hypothetical protein